MHEPATPNRRRRLALVSLLIGVIVVLTASFLFWAAQRKLPAQFDTPIETFGTPAPRPAAPPAGLRVLSWNLHYAVGLAADDKLPPRETVEQNLRAIAELLKRERVDVALFQEIDFGAARTHRIDMVKRLAELSGLPYAARALNWDKNYLPFPYWPISAHWGRMLSGTAVLSRYPLSFNRMYILPKPKGNNWLYNLFYIDRGIQVVDLDLGGPLVRICHTHLEAYDIPARTRQAQLLVSTVRAHSRPLMLLVGDFNALPPDATQQHGFVDSPNEDFRGDRTIATVVSGLPEFHDALDDTPGRVAPTLTFPSDRPNRRLDYLFSRGFVRVSGRVLDGVSALSDHRPLLAVYRLTKPEGK